MKRRHRMAFGAELVDGGVRFRLWAPARSALDIEVTASGQAARYPMARRDGGWFECVVPGAAAGARYAFVIDDLRVPDPASRSNPDDVHGASAVVDPASYDWSDGDWRGRPWEEAVIYELHVGAFTDEGTFAAAEGRLDALAALGITAVELMPLAEFPGRRNWGYDGVLLFAPDASYGTPEDLKRFVDAAHRRGLMVLLDVVYNHFGPEGNYLHRYAPQFFTDRHSTPWGSAINFDGADSNVVRDFYVANALYWLDEFHFDGLRLDAVHAIIDDSPVHIVTEIAAAVRAHCPQRHVHLVVENDDNRARLLERGPDRRPRIADAQWSDDVHHLLHVLATGETDGYYSDFATQPLEQLGRALAEGFAYQGQASPFRGGRARGEPSAHLPPTAFVVYTQTHDQVGNRAHGERLSRLADEDAVRQAAAIVLLSPHIPMVFMGEEFRASTPFLFFCDFGAELAEAVRNGRRQEFSRFARFSDPAAQAAIPDPNDVATFRSSRLDWSEVSREPHARWRNLYVDLLRKRRQHVVPVLAASARGGTWHVDGNGLHVEWTIGRHVLHMAANYGEAGVVVAMSGRAIHEQRGNLQADGKARIDRHGVVVALAGI